MFYNFLLIGDAHVLKTPAFADSVSEGDIRWEKSKYNSENYIAFSNNFEKKNIILCKQYFYGYLVTFSGIINVSILAKMMPIFNF